MNDNFLVLKNIYKKYDSVVAVDNLSLTVPQKGLFALIGPNGAGKSSTLQMICGLIKPDQGDITLRGANFQMLNPSDAQYRPLIGICLQQNLLWNKLTCLEHLKFTSSLYQNQAHRHSAIDCEKLLLDLNLWEKRNTYAQHLSGGMKRRLNIALALVHNPQILILDEPEAGLDPQSKVLVRNFLINLAQKMSILLTGHNMDEIQRLANEIAIMDFGKIIWNGTAEDLQKEDQSLEDLFMNLTGKKLRD